MLKDFVGAHLKDPQGIVEPPNSFLSFEETMNILSKVELKSVILEGQEASIDPIYPLITETLHKEFGSYNTLLTNCLTLPDLSHTDKVEIGIKAVTDSIHHYYTGVSNVPILDNIVKIYDAGKKLLIESVLIPGLIEADEIERVAKFVAGIDKNIPFIILPYFKSGDNPWRRPNPKEMEKAAKLTKRHLKSVFFFRGDETLDFEVESLFPEDIERLLQQTQQKEDDAMLLSLEQGKIPCPA